MHAFDSAGQDLVRAFVDMQTAEWEDEIKYLQPLGVQWLEHATVLDSEEEVDDLGDDLLDDIGDALDNELPCGGSAGAGWEGWHELSDVVRDCGLTPASVYVKKMQGFLTTLLRLLS